MDISQDIKLGKKVRWTRQFLFAVMTFFMTISTVQASIDFCWKDSYGRGVGTIPSTCTAGLQKEGALCYEPCKAGYETSTLGACLQECNNGYEDQGLFCRKAEYHVDEYPWQFGDPLNDSKMYSRCEAKHGKGNCWKPLLVVVEKCKADFEHILGFCRPKTPPNCSAEGYAGQFDLSCTKDTYFKTPKPAKCASNQENNAGLCYKRCAGGSNGVGPVCWSSCSAKTLPTECGAGCASDAASCATQTASLVMSVLDSAVSIATAVGTLGVATAVKQGTMVATKSALEQGGKASIKEMAKQAGKMSKGVALQLAKDEIKGIVVKNGFDYTAAGASAVGNAMSFVGNISDISNGNYESEEERDFMIAQEVLNNVSLLDPSGVVGIVAAYTKPKCSVLASGQVPQSSGAGATDTLLAEYDTFVDLLNARVGIADMKIVDIEEQQMENTKQKSGLEFPFITIILARKAELRIQIEQLYKDYNLAKTDHANPATKSAEMLYIREMINKAEKARKETETEWRAVQAGTSALIPKSVTDQLKVLHSVNFTSLLNQAKQERNKAAANRRNANKLFNEIVEKRNTQAFWALSAGSGYAAGLNFSGAKAYCESNNGRLATKQQLINANQLRDFSMCAQGWLADGSTGYVMKGTHAGCGRNGFNSGGSTNKATKRAAYCVGPAVPQSAGANLVAPALKVTAAMTLGSNKATYFFYSDSSYARISENSTGGLDPGYPKKLPGGWNGIPTEWFGGIDAALPYEGSKKGYMWRDGKYLRLNDTTKDNGYPKSMPGGWLNMPASWKGNVDAAMYFEPFKNHYFFKGNEYLSLTGTKVDAGSPKKLPGGWVGMPADFIQGIDAATFRNGHVYMIKGHQYIRFTGTKVDPGYPKPMSEW